MPVIEALDRVLEILRTTELYSPQLGAKDDDPHASALVEGLMSVRVSDTAAGGSLFCRLSRSEVFCLWAGVQRALCIWGSVQGQAWLPVGQSHPHL